MVRPKHTVVAVLWVDTQASDDPKVLPIPMLSFGIVVEETDAFIRITAEIHADGGRRDHVAIPKGVVKKVIKIGSFAEPNDFAKYREVVFDL